MSLTSPLNSTWNKRTMKDFYPIESLFAEEEE